jgi:hypothetical protein
MPTAQWWVRIALDWLPFLIFIGLILYLLRGPLQRQAKQIKDWQVYRDAHLQALQEISGKLDRIAIALDKADETKRASNEIR